MKRSIVFVALLLAAPRALAQNLTQPAAAPATQPAPADHSSATDALKLESVWDFVAKGGPTMIVIALCSLLALTVIVERAVLLRRRGVVPPHLIAGLKAVSSDPAKAIEYCETEGSPAAGVLAAIIRHRGQPPDVLKEAVKDAGARAMVRLRRRMRLLSALPQVATMLGLLGTIFGMIKTFQAVATSGQSLGKTEVLAKGIFEAWTNTAAGLLVAIPVLIAYHVLMGRVDDAASELDRMAVDWIAREDSSVAVHEVRTAAAPLPVMAAPSVVTSAGPALAAAVGG